MNLDLRYLPKRLRKSQQALMIALVAPMLNRAYPPSDIINQLVSVQPIHESPGVVASVNFLMTHDIVIDFPKK